MTLKEIKIKKIPLFLAKHAFKVSLAFFLLALLIGLTVFYRYNFIDRETGFGDLGQGCSLDDVVYTNVVKVWEKHSQIFEQILFKNYRNIFLIKIEENVD